MQEKLKKSRMMLEELKEDVELDTKLLNALSFAISLMKELEDIKDGGVLPKEKECVCDKTFYKNHPTWNACRHETALRFLRNASVERLKKIVLDTLLNIPNRPFETDEYKATYTATELHRVLINE